VFMDRVDLPRGLEREHVHYHGHDYTLRRPRGLRRGRSWWPGTRARMVRSARRPMSNWRERGL
jgi:hypothetical protein